MVFAAALLFFAGPAFADDQADTAPIWQRFSESDPNSTVRINHQPLTDYLEATIFPVGRSYRILGNEKPNTYKASRIKTAKSLSASRFEGSRIFFHAFSEDHKTFFLAYQKGLERLSNRRALSNFNQNEQLAYWLNLYNVVVINKLVDEYPIQKLKKLRKSKVGKPSFWTEKITTVEGVRLSLTDIENILFNNFETPLVAFGLFQGSIGGPRILNYAYTGGNVWPSLEKNAVEFVNSNRGLRPPTGTRMIVSSYFEWAMEAFGGSKDNILTFIKVYADPKFIGDVSEVKSLNFKYYDWAIADVRGGSVHSGQINQFGGILATGGGAPQSANSMKNTEPFSTSIPRTTSALLDPNFTDTVNGVPADAIDLVLGIRNNTRLPIPVFTTEECGPEAVCTIENIDLGDGA